MKSVHLKCSSKPRFAVIVSRFNEGITEQLLQACLNEFSRNKVCECEVQVVRVPGAFEIPVTAMKMAMRKNISAVICLGAIIRGQTLHYELIAAETARGAQEVALRTGKPVVFEVLAADTVALCQARAKVGDRDNKGASAARVAIEMVEVFRKN
ncbi:MAG: 6,7-dimethyl-8-ribityllumazine synthase [Candidatus Omnitrophica bacterium]|nr:6,7-dimethyl-8-ribityllumazine synthase [Candidatus Omnitrophota bacterium]